MEGLKEQIKEKQIREEEEKKREEAYVLKHIRDVEIAKRLDKQIEEVCILFKYSSIFIY